MGSTVVYFTSSEYQFNIFSRKIDRIAIFSWLIRISLPTNLQRQNYHDDVYEDWYHFLNHFFQND